MLPEKIAIFKESLIDTIAYFSHTSADLYREILI